MSLILNEIYQHFNKLADEQEQLERAEFDKSQFDLIQAEAGLGNDHPTRYLQNSILVTAEDEKVLEEKKFPFGHEREDIVEVAHPETVVVADGPHTTGVVDNQNQQHQKIIDMVNKMPTGNVFHDLRLAEQVHELIAIANDLDEKGHYVEAKAVDEIALELTALKKKPKLTKEAFAFFAPLISLVGWKGLAAGLASLGLTSATIAGALGWEEDLPDDARDLLSNIEGWKDDPDYASQKNTISRLYNNASSLVRMADSIYQLIDQPSPELSRTLNQFGSTLNAVAKDIMKLDSLFSGVMGEDFELTKGKLRDVQSNLNDLMSLSLQGDPESAPATPSPVREPSPQELGGHDHDHDHDHDHSHAKTTVSPKPEPKSEPESKRIEGIQEFLKQYVDGTIFVTGKMDAKTRAALDKFAETVSVDLGVGNLDGPRLEREATNASLRKLYDIYKHPWKYTK